MKHVIESIRNVGLFGHQGGGKTSLAEALLYVTGALDRLGRTDDGSATTDFDQEEQRRHISINLAIAPCEWNGTRINVIDAPGYLDFTSDVASAMQVVEAAILVTPAQNEPEVGFEIAWNLAAERGVPRAIFINKMDRENADFDLIFNLLRSRYGNSVTPLQIPVGTAESFSGVVDLVEQVAITGVGRDVTSLPIPEELNQQVQDYREILLESVAEGDDSLVEKFLNGEELTRDEIILGLHKGIDSCKIIPVLCGSALKDVGMTNLLDVIAKEFPNPVELKPVHGYNPETGKEIVLSPVPTESLSALVFKTIADPFLGTLTYFRILSGVMRSGETVFNATRKKDERVGQIYHARGKSQESETELTAGDFGVTAKLADTHTGDTLCNPNRMIVVDYAPLPEPIFEQAIAAKSKVDEDKLGPALQRVQSSDPAFKFYRNPETNQTLICGAGETHLAIVVERLRKFGANVDIIPQRVGYRETITATAQGQGRHKKQTGGRGQFGDCYVRLESNPGAGIQFVDAIVGGAVPKQYLPAIERGIRQAAEMGIIAGYPVVDFKATCYDGSYHDVDSSEAAFIMAGQAAFHNVAAAAHPVLMEPIMKLCVNVPEGMIGDVMSDLTSRRGRIVGNNIVDHGRVELQAFVPHSEILRYAIDLRSLSRGRGSFHSELSHYDPVPDYISAQVIEDHQKIRSNAH